MIFGVSGVAAKPPRPASTDHSWRATLVAPRSASKCKPPFSNGGPGIVKRRSWYCQTEIIGIVSEDIYEVDRRLRHSSQEAKEHTVRRWRSHCKSHYCDPPTPEYGKKPVRTAKMLESLVGKVRLRHVVQNEARGSQGIVQRAIAYSRLRRPRPTKCPAASYSFSKPLL